MEYVYVYMLTFTLFDSAGEIVNTIGIFSSYKLAREAYEKLRDKPGFNKVPVLIDSESLTADEEEGFYIAPYVLNQMYWAEGFDNVIPE